MFGMEKNEGVADRITRIVIGFALVAVGYLYLAGWQSIAAYVLGAGTLFTGIIGFCSVYKLLGINTAKCAHCETPSTPQTPTV